MSAHEYAQQRPQAPHQQYVPDGPGHAPLAKNPLAVPGMIVGIVAAGISWIPFLGILALPLGIVALVFGGIALYKALSHGSTLGRPQAITALATGAGGLLIWTFWLLVWASPTYY